MNFLGKALTFLVVLLSFAFMIIAVVVNASHRNWRDVVLGPDGLKRQIETVETTNNQLRNAVQSTQGKLDQEQAARRTSLAALQTQLSQKIEQLADASGQVAQLTAQNTELVQLDRARAKDLEEKATQITTLTTSLREEQVDRDLLFRNSLELTDELNQLKGVLQNQLQRSEQLAAQVTRYKEVTDSKGININDPLDGAPPERNGNVLVVSRPRNQVEVSIGSDDGLRQGHLLDVTRRGSFITRLRVRYTEPDRAVAEILKDYSNQTIQEGDRVDTTIE